jgi:Bacterial Ig-like domain (group 3)/Chitobiase/beta-hexosaminidase C-terminal domain/Beta-propeller repeat
MRQRSRLVLAFSVLIAVANGGSISAQGPSPVDSRADINASFANLPLQFEANQGQVDPSVHFTSHGSGYSLFLTDTEAVLLLGKSGPSKSGPAAGRVVGTASLNRGPSTRRTGVLRMQLAGARANADISGADKLPGTANYFIGNDPAKWRSGVPTYARVRYAQVYDGIDLVYYGNQRQLEYDFVLSPGASADSIRLRFAGTRQVKIDSDGNLRVTAGEGTVAFHKPVVYQEANGARQPVEGRFSLAADHSVGFAVGAYDHTRPLTIDPVLEYATYLGGSTWDQAWAIAVDPAGNAYVGGGTESIDFPTTASTFDTTKNAPVGTMTGFISKLNSNGTGLVYSTYVGGSKATSVNAIAVDSSGNVYAGGGTVASDFPETQWGMITFGNPGNAFVVELPPSGSQLFYSAQFGGNGGEYVAGIAVDNIGSAYVTGPTSSVDFPIQGGYQPTRLSGGTDTVFVSKINPTGTAFVYSTYLGGSIDDKSTAIAIDSSLNAYITGSTRSTDFPVSSTAFQKTKPTGITQTTGFVAKLNAAGTALVYSTFLGGTTLDEPAGIAVNASGQAFVTGSTSSSDFPVTSGALKTTKSSLPSSPIGFVSKLNATGSALAYSTFLGGSAANTAAGIALDASGNAFVVGRTNSDDFPITPGAIQTTRSGTDAFVSKLNPAGSALLYSTFLGGSQADYANAVAVNGSGRAFVAGGTESTDFPATYGAVQGANNAADLVTAFVARLDLSSATGGPLATTTTLTGTPNPATSGNTVKFIASVNPAKGSVMPSGSVGFTIDGKSVGTQTLDSGGVATYSTSLLSVGPHTVVAAYAGSTSFAASTSATLTETIKPPQAARPVFSPSAGAYTSPQQVTITDSTPYAVIYYTMDGTTPTTSSPKYAGPVTVSSTTTFKAFATATGYSQSIVSTAAYTVTLAAAAPVFSPAGGIYGVSKLVTLTTTTPNASIYYTIDGGTTVSSAKYTEPIAVNASETINATAIAAGFATSPVGSATYTLVASPEAFTGLATSISTSGAKLNATVNNHGVTATVWFAWGTSTSSLTTTTAKVSVTASNNAQPASASITGLASKTIYYFRPVIATVGGNSYGAVQSFTTK